MVQLNVIYIAYSIVYYSLLKLYIRDNIDNYCCSKGSTLLPVLISKNLHISPPNYPTNPLSVIVGSITPPQLHKVLALSGTTVPGCHTCPWRFCPQMTTPCHGHTIPVLFLRNMKSILQSTSLHQYYGISSFSFKINLFINVTWNFKAHHSFWIFLKKSPKDWVGYTGKDWLKTGKGKPNSNLKSNRFLLLPFGFLWLFLKMLTSFLWTPDRSYLYSTFS